MIIALLRSRIARRGPDCRNVLMVLVSGPLLLSMEHELTTRLSSEVSVPLCALAAL